MHVSRQLSQAFILGVLSASSSIYIYFNFFKNCPAQIIGEVDEIFLPAKLLSKKIRAFVNQTIDILKKNKQKKAFQMIRENINTIGNRAVIWDTHGAPIICTKYSCSTTHDGEFESLGHDYEQSIEEMPDPVSPEEFAEWKKIAEKGGGWCVLCSKSITNYIKYECIYIKKYNNMYITCGYTV